MKVFAFDTETTSLIPNRTLPLDKQPHIIQFYGCVADLESGEIESEIHHLIRPPRPFTDEEKRIAQKSHRLTDEDLADKPFFAAVADDIRAAIENAPRPMAHNASFDVEMVEIEFERLGQTIHWPKRALCTVEATLHLKGYRLKLDGLYDYLFAEKFIDAHRADKDVGALVKCACELYRRGEI